MPRKSIKEKVERRFRERQLQDIWERERNEDDEQMRPDREGYRP